MNLSKVTYEMLVDASIDCGKLAETLASAKEKREITSTSLSQTAKSFSGSEGFKMKRTLLTDAEDLACSIEAFDTHMAKAVKLWGLDAWEIPAAMVDSAKAVWPFKREARPKIDQPAPVSA